MRGPIPSLPKRNVRNHKTRNPGFKPGDYWVICDRCGCAVRSSQARLTWEGYVVCPDDWEPRHPQDFVRAKHDQIAPGGFVRPDQLYGTESYVPSLCESRTAIADEAVADCAIADGPEDLIPPPTPFNNGL